MTEKVWDQRLRLFYIVVLVTLVVLAGRMWYLQIVRGDDFARLADGNRLRRIQLTPSRGIIYDRHGIELIRSRPAFSVSIVPGGIPEDSQEVLARLGSILGMSIEELEEAMERGAGFPYESVRVVRDVDPSTVIAVEENRTRLPGVFIEEEPVREYLFDGLATHALGYLGAISEQELQRYGAAYSGSDLVGKSGIEQLYESELRGLPGSMTVEVNALSRPIRVVGSVDPVPGHNLVLAIDQRLQAAAEQAFVEHTAVVRETYPDALNGAVIAMNPQTGEVLAMVSVPGYEVNKLLEPSSRNVYYRELISDPRQPFFNRAIQGQYGPGSSFKPFTAAAILEEGVIGADETFNATGTSRHGVRDWVITRGLAPFGRIDMVEALAMSSNHYFAEFGAQTGIDRLSEWIREFGFGSPTGIRTQPPESRGLVPDRDWKRERFAGREAYEQVWYPSDTEQISIGQGFITVTPIQMAVAYSAIANRGTVYRPTLVTEVHSPEGDIVSLHEPELLFEMGIAETTWDSVIKGMQQTVTHPRGTARTAFADFPLDAAGKTGSYEIPGRDAHGWFGAFAPADDPELVVVVVVEHGGGGGSGAAPIARRVFDTFFGFDEEDQEADIETEEGEAG